MAFLMLLIFSLFIIISYIYGKRNLLSPWFLLCTVFFATFLIVLVNFKNWDVEINGYFVLYVSTAILVFGIGTYVVNLCQPKVKVKSTNTLLQEAKINVKYPVNIFLILSVVFGVLYIFKLFLDAGSAASLSQRLRIIYENRINDNYSPGFVFNQMSEIVRAIAYINTYRIFIKLFLKSDKINIIKLVIPIFVFFATALVVTDRNIFLRFGIFFICLWVLFYYQNSRKKDTNFKIIRGIVVIAIVILVLFYFMGKMKLYSSDFLKSLSIYGGSALNNFNLWIRNFDGNLLYGQSTFTQFFDSLGTLLNPLGFNIHGAVDEVDVFTSYISSNGYNYVSNIYTALKPYVEDFGYFGVILFPFIMGCFYQWLFIKTKKSKYGFNWLIYCLLIYPVIFFPILEQLFRRFHLGFIYELVWLAIIYYCAFGRKKKSVTKRSIKYVNGA